MKSILLLVLLNLALSHSLEDSDRKPTTDDLKALRKELFETRGYDKYVLPIPSNSGAVKLLLDYNLVHISGFDIRSQTLTTHGWLFQQWKDESLKWDNTTYKFIPNIRVPSDQLYRPDVLAFNGINYNNQNIMNTNAVVDSNGMVLWVPPITNQALCKVNLKRWPYDEHICFLKFGSWTLDGYIMDVWPMNEEKPGFLTNFWENTEFDVERLNVTREVKFYDCCKEPYTDLSFYFKITRKPTLYHFLISIPTLVAIISSLISFWFPIRSNLRFLSNGISFVLLTIILIYLATQFGISSIGIPFAVRFISLTTLCVALVQIWSTFGYNISLSNCQMHSFYEKLSSPLFKGSELTKLTQPEKSAEDSEPNNKDIIKTIDKIVFLLFVSVLVLHFVF